MISGKCINNMNQKNSLIVRLAGWRPDTRQCYVLFMIFMVYAVTRDLLEQYIPLFSYTDELIALSAIPLFCMEFIRNKPQKIFQKGGYARYIIGFLAFGLAGSIAYQYQPFLKVALPDMFLCAKFWLAIYAGKVVFENFSFRDYAEKINLFIRVVVWCFAILILVDFLVWILNSGNGLFHGEIRYGIKSVKLFYSHLTIFAACCVFLIAMLAAIKDYVRGTEKYMLALCIMLVLTLRGKAFGAAVMIAFLYVCIYIWKKSLSLKMLACCIPIMIVVGWNRIYYFFFSSLQDESARYQLLEKSIQVANDHFPLGSGFGTFASYLSAQQYYSPLYKMYGLSEVWGLWEGSASFVSDNYWPMILGQTGWLGFLCMGFAVLFLFLRIQKLYAYKGIYFSGLIIITYLMIASMAESAFVHPTAIPFAVCLGVFLEKEEN